MSPYMQLKSPFRSPSIDLGQGLDRKAEYMDKDGVLRRSSSVTRRMIQRGASITDADDVMPNEQLHTSVDTRKVEKQASRKASLQLGEEATRKAAANAALKYQAKIEKEEGLKKANQRVAERVRRYEELHLSLETPEDQVDITESSAAMSPAKDDTYIDEEGNLRRRVTIPSIELNESQDDFVPGPATPPLPAPDKIGEQHDKAGSLSYMSGNEAEAPQESHDVESDAMYHVRLIHSWPPQTSSQQDKALVSSFYGLQLELRGNVKDRNDSQSPITLFNDGQTVSKTGEIRNPVSSPLKFGSSLASSSALLDSLDNISGPFELIVLGKVPIPPPDDSTIDEDTRAALQQMASVQVKNTLLEIDGERFLGDRGATGADIYRRLWMVTSRASLALPFELTLRRHNLAQVAAKIVPFARRKDVQDAQTAQLAKLAAEETALPINIRRKKLFLIQQLDFEREHYLVAYLSGPLQELHARIMDSCQWQIYEFGKTLWYFHAPTVLLCAQHPLRNHPEARELIERVQQQVQQAVRRLQRKTRSHQRRQRLMRIIQSEVRRREEEKRKEQQLQHAVLRIQHRIRAYQRRKRFLAIIQAEKIRQKEVRRQQQLAEERQREEQRIEEKRQLETMKLEQQRLQQELCELKLELQQLKLLKETKSPVQDTQSSVNCDDVIAIETMRREEQRVLQQRLEKLEVEFHNRKEKPAEERETPTCENDAIERLRIAEQQRTQRAIEELELKLRHLNTKVVTESVTQTSGRCGDNLRDKAVDTGDDLEWQRYLTLLRVSIKNKKKMSSPKSRHTQTESVDGEKTFMASSMLRAPHNAVSFSSRQVNGEWKGFPSWQRGSNSGSSSNNSSASSLLTLRSSPSQFDELDILAPPARTFESFFAPHLIHEQPPPPLVERSWKQDSTFLPLKTSRKLVEVALGHQPLTVQLQEYREPIRPIRTTGNYAPLTQQSPVSNSSTLTKLPYITRRQKKLAP